MIEILLSLGGVVIGGVIGLAGTYLQTKNQRYIRQREEILPVSSRALAAAEEVFQAIIRYDGFDAIPAADAEQTRLEKNNAMAQQSKSRHELQIALDEVSLLVRGIEPESNRLRASVIFWNRSEGNQKWVHEYNEARQAFLERIRQAIGT